MDEIVSYLAHENTIVFVDETVLNLYPVLNSINTISIPCNEEMKTFNGIDIVLSKLVERKANIKTKLVVIGGGVLQDLIGFCASIFCRGIEYIFIPTTLLSQADSCVGGKTSINFNNRKNILGTFYPPSKILINTKFLETLSELDYISGLGEIYKFHILQDKIEKFDLQNDLNLMIRDSLDYKIKILMKDEFDNGERKFLNFGHTFGHAIESISDYSVPHGVSVILGSMIATRVSKELGYNVDKYDDIMKKGIYLLRKTKIKFDEKWFDFDLLSDIIASDKKNTGKMIMVLIENTPFISEMKNTDIFQPILKDIYESI